MARVLIAEADEPTRQQVVSFLRSAGHDVTAYSDGDAVLDHIVSGHVDIIVTDLELPGPGGLELLCRVRGSRDFGSRLPAHYAESGMSAGSPAP